MRAFAAALIACALVVPASARADGDPASDVLISERVFYPYYEKLPKESMRRLSETLAKSKEKGYPIRVALIAHDYDLGSAALLYRKPQTYAKFLAQELAQFHGDWLLVVMPNGYGVYHCLPKKRAGGYSDPCEGATPTRGDERMLASLPTQEKSRKDWAAVADVAVRALAERHGASFGGPPLVPIAAGLALLAAAAGGLLLLRRRRRARA